MSCCKSNTSVETGCPAVTLTPLPNHTTSLYNTIHIQCCTNLSPLSLSSLFPLSTPKRVLPVCILFRKLQSMDCCTIYVYLICLTRTCFQFCCLNQSRRTLISTQQTHISRWQPSDRQQSYLFVTHFGCLERAISEPTKRNQESREEKSQGITMHGGKKSRNIKIVTHINLLNQQSG